MERTGPVQVGGWFGDLFLSAESGGLCGDAEDGAGEVDDYSICVIKI